MRNQLLIRNVVSNIKEQGIMHESEDIKERPVESILAEYGYMLSLSDLERYFIRRELLDLAAAAEIAEAARITHRQLDPEQMLGHCNCEVI